MKCLFDSYSLDQKIPVREYLKNRKFAKYFNREAAAALVCASKLFHEVPITPTTPFYYETGEMEYEDYGLDRILAASTDEDGDFSQHLFVDKGTKAVMPLTQFKALYNMPLSLIAIEHGLIGDNSVIYASARGLLTQALYAPVDKGILLGSGKVHRDGRVEVAFAMVDKDEIHSSPYLSSDKEGIELFRGWCGKGMTICQG